VWNLGTLTAGSGGRRRISLMVPAGAAAGSLLLTNEAAISATGVLAESARANAAVAVEASSPLALAATFGRDPTQAGAALTGTLTVTNNGATSLNGVVLQARVPVGVNAFSPALLTAPGTCIVGISNNGLCDAVELANWDLGTLAPGASVVVSMPTVVAAAMTSGRLMYLDARVRDDTGRVVTQSRTALVSPFVDGDADTVADIYDVCPFYLQTGLGDADQDGRGDECECGDQSGDGLNTVSDLIAINVAIFNPSEATPLCDSNGDANCTVGDIVAANIEIFSPTSTSTCARQPVAGP